jgi:hypothetical protein
VHAVESWAALRRFVANTASVGQEPLDPRGLLEIGEACENRRHGAYPCREDASTWHIGHSNRQTPSCYHYDLFTTLDDILEGDALVSPKPIRAGAHLKRHFSGKLLRWILELEERVPMTWFTWDGAWDLSRAPHPGVFLNYPVEERRAEGLLRVEVPAYTAKLRWSDYFQRNRTTRNRRDYLAGKGDPGQWLATDAVIPLATFRSLCVWHRGAWVAVGDVSDEEMAAYLAEAPT